MLRLVHLCGRWETSPKMDAAPRRRPLREFGAGNGDKETYASVF
jgi:hypothetical protein